MTQFHAYRNPNPATRAETPFLLDVQSDLVAVLATRLVAPLRPAAAMKGQIVTRLMPVIPIGGRDHVLVTPQLAGIRQQDVGAAVADLSAYRADIVAALDLLLTGF